jgi:DDE domain
MGQVLHGSATTTVAVPRAIRRHTLLPLDDCLYALQPTIPRLTRSSQHRCIKPPGISRLPQVEGEASPKRKFKPYPIGYFHIDITEVRTAQGKLVAIERTSKFAFVELHEKVARFWCTLLTALSSRASGGFEGGAMARFLGLAELFEGRHFDREIIVLCVRWHLRFKLSFRDLVEMMAERGLSIAHTTIMRWVHHYAPEFERRRSHFAQPAGDSWRVDETYVKVRGEWVYLYRAVDRAGNTVDFRLSPRRDVAAAKAFLGRPERAMSR